jgi:hypothetical protein
VQTVLAGAPTVAVASLTTLPSIRILQLIGPGPWALRTNTSPPKPVNCVDQGSFALTARSCPSLV